MGKFNSHDHYIYYCGQQSHRRNRIALIINKIVQNTVLGYNLKNDRMILVRLQGKPFNIRVIQVYAPITDSEEAEADQFYENLEDLEITLKKRCFIDHRGLGLECKSRKPRDTWHNSQVWPWRIK